MKRVLILDDSEIVVHLTAFVVEQLGYEAIQFTKGKDAVEYLTNSEEPYPDVIIVDHYLSASGDTRKTGARVLQKLKEYGVHIPVILASSNNNQKVIDKYIELGVVGYVCKNDENYIDELQHLTKTLLHDE